MGGFVSCYLAAKRLAASTGQTTGPTTMDHSWVPLMVQLQIFDHATTKKQQKTTNQPTKKQPHKGNDSPWPFLVGHTLED